MTTILLVAHAQSGEEAMTNHDEVLWHAIVVIAAAIVAVVAFAMLTPF